MIGSLLPQQMVAFGERTLRGKEQKLWATGKAKRVMDVCLACGLLGCVAPMMIVMMLALRLTGAPVFTRQIRSGQGGRHFTQYGLNTADIPLRFLPFKLFLLHWGLDRAPQLWNVLRGNMSMVGPEAAMPNDRERYRYEIPNYGARHFARPGMTGRAQVAGWNGKRNVRKRAVHDSQYVAKGTASDDIKILISSVLPKQAR